MRHALLLLSLWLASAAAAQSVEPLLAIASPDPNSFEGFGAWVAAVGDVDQDGADDLVVAAPLAGGFNTGRVYLVSASGAIVSSVVTPNPRREGRFGSAAAFVGDINGDGPREALVGAPGETSRTGEWFDYGGDGRAYVLAGGSGDVLFELVSPNADTLGGTYLTGRFGAAVAGPGDLTGDGVPDFVVGAWEEDTAFQYAGRVYVFSGADGSLVRTITSPSEQHDGWFGFQIEPVSDLDGDGVADLMVGAAREKPSPDAFTLGRVHVLSGASGALLFTLDSGLESSLPAMDGDLAEVGDVDGDGVPDLAVGGPQAGPPSVVYLFSGATGERIRTIPDPDVAETGLTQFGRSIAPVGDVDGDGVPDLFVGAPFATLDPALGPTGRVSVVSGATGEPLLTIASTHPRLNGRFGLSVAWTDIDGDGQNDPVVGAPYERLVAAEPTGGLVYLYTQQALQEAFAGTVAGDPGATAGALRLDAPRPHPASGRTTLDLRLGAAGTVRVDVVDALGRRVALLADGEMASGTHTVDLDVSGFAAGVYLVRARTAEDTASRRVVVR